MRTNTYTFTHHGKSGPSAGLDALGRSSWMRSDILQRAQNGVNMDETPRDNATGRGTVDVLDQIGSLSFGTKLEYDPASLNPAKLEFVKKDDDATVKLTLEKPAPGERVFESRVTLANGEESVYTTVYHETDGRLTVTETHTGPLDLSPRQY